MTIKYIPKWYGEDLNLHVEGLLSREEILTNFEYDRTSILRDEVKILSINNALLGALKSFYPEGFQCFIETTEGDEIVVDAEEDAGIIYEPSYRKLNDWNLIIEIVNT